MSGGYIGVIFAVLLFALGGGIGKDAEQRVAAMAMRMKVDHAMQQTSLELMLRGQGLEATLRQMAAGVESRKVDETTTLVRLEVVGTTLRYVYRISLDVADIPVFVGSGLIKQNCAYEPLHSVIAAGATVELVYQRANGSQIGIVRVTRQDCGY